MSGALQMFLESNISTNPALAHNVVNIAERLTPAFADSGFFFFFFSFFILVRSVNSFIPDIRGCGKILKETNHVK